MQLRYVFSELGQGLRRNLSMHIAVILTLFVSLTLVGLGVLLNQQADKAAEHWGSQLQITVCLCKDKDDNPACTGEVTDAQKQRDREGRRGQPRGRRLPLRVQGGGLRQGQGAARPGQVRGPEPGGHRGRHAAVDLDHAQGPRRVPGHHQRGGRPRRGLRHPRPARGAQADLRRRSTRCSGARSATAAFLVLAALLLVANTIRLAAFARRREIGIMRLVGASTLYIALPFLLEALVTALIGVALAGGRARRRSCTSASTQRLGGPAELHAVDRAARVRPSLVVDRDPRSDAHPASDTRADPQIPQSLTSARLRVESFTSPNTEGRPVRLFPRTARHRLVAASAAVRAGGRRAGRPARQRRRPQAPAEARRRARSSSARHDLEDSSAQLRAGDGRARRGPSRARRAPAHELPAARASCGAAQVRRPRDAGASSTAAERAARAGAQADLADGQQALDDAAARRSTDTITSIYEEGDPQLLALLRRCSTRRRPPT